MHQKATPGAAETVQQVKVLANKRNSLSVAHRTPHDRKEELTLTNCPLTTTSVH